MLRELYVGNYKNLRSVRVPVTERVVLYGRNGAGRTNLLEALALIAGDVITVRQIARRAIMPDPGDLQVVLTASSADLDSLVKLDGPKGAVNQLFWSSLGVDEAPASWEDGIADSWFPDEVKAAIAEPSQCGVRYSLASLRGIEELARHDWGRAYREARDEDHPTLVRRFERTLCVPRGVGEGLRRVNATLLDAARPLLVDAVDGSEWIDVIVLPPAESIPLEVSWLSRERSDDELWSDYVEAIDAAAGFVRLLKAEARRVLGYPECPDETWDASQVSPRDWFYNRAQAAVRSLLSQLRISDGEEGGLTIEVASAERQQVLIGSAGNQAWFTRLSSGERALVDEAMLDVARALRADMLDLGATVGMLHTSDQGALVDLLVDLEPFLDWLHEEYWGFAVVDAVVAWGRRKVAERFGRPFRSDVPVVRVFDEPERHLHPGAREDLAAVLHERGDVGGGAVVIATHAVEFLARDGWQHLHLYATPQGAAIDGFDPGDLDRTHDIARDLGIRSGELLTRYRYLLLVEGAHDEAFLDGYCGGSLRTLGVLVLPMYGAHEVLQAAEMHLVARHLDVGIGVLLDHARTSRSKEAQLMAELVKVAKRRGIAVDYYRLRRPDIIAYLDDDEVRRDAPAFLGFHEVERRWRRPPRNSDFKQLASDLAGGFEFNRRAIRDLAKRTASSRRRPPPDLAEVLADLASAAKRPLPN